MERIFVLYQILIFTFFTLKNILDKSKASEKGSVISSVLEKDALLDFKSNR